MSPRSASFVLVLSALVACDHGAEPTFRASPAALAVEVPVEVPPEPVTDDLEPLPVLLELDPLARPLVLEPADLTTSTAGIHPTVGVPRRGLSEAEVGELAARFDLITWPEREVVHTTPVYLDEAGPNGAYSRIVLSPDAPLEDRWYALRASYDELDAPLASVNPRDGDYVVSRFRLGSSPILQRVHARARADGGGDILAVFTEPVRAEASPLLVEVDGRSVDCRLGNARAVAADSGATTIWLDCPVVPVGSTLSVTAASPIYASSGETVRSLDGVEPTSVPIVMEPVVLGREEPRHDLLFIDEPEPRPEPRLVATTFVPRFGLDDAR